MSDQTTNERIARACGFEFVEQDDLTGCVVCRDERCGYCKEFYDFVNVPGDALLAAEKYGLFDEERHGCELHRYGNKWHVVGYREPLASGTFCEVVCESILRLEEMGAAGDNGTQEAT